MRIELLVKNKLGFVDGSCSKESVIADLHLKNAGHIVQQRLFQFLMGLNETYSANHSQILLMIPLPTVSQAYSMLMQEEAQ
ncbi:hypothetical protein PVK06_008092 [Gossypium arboreum]|uniref:Uncharacterized protein n=1 Tax=Gossypium arboreum TaxID=29729 RepID=A0ABR0QJT6_GOSAR|nr:hypothetical protein PVK06_008092 [Gossypium arboreum]